MFLTGRPVTNRLASNVAYEPRWRLLLLLSLDTAELALVYVIHLYVEPEVAQKAVLNAKVDDMVGRNIVKAFDGVFDCFFGVVRVGDHGCRACALLPASEQP